MKSIEIPANPNSDLQSKVMKTEEAIRRKQNRSLSRHRFFVLIKKMILFLVMGSSFQYFLEARLLFAELRGYLMGFFMVR